MTQDTRKDRRVKIVSLNVRYKSATVDEFIENHAHDVSRGGIYIKTANPFPPGTLLKFEIRLASDQAVIAGVGRVVWKRDAGSANGERPAGMGVKFIKIDEPSKSVIDRLVNTKSDAGKAFESEQEMPAALVDAPVAKITPAAATAKLTPPAAAAANTPVRKATMMGLGTIPSQTPAPGEATAGGLGAGGAKSPPRVSTAAALGATAPAHPAASAPRPSGGGGMFPSATGIEDQPPKQEQTVMKQAAELLEEALREAGGSMEEIGTNPLFSGTGPAPLEVKSAPPPSASERETVPHKPSDKPPSADAKKAAASASPAMEVKTPAADVAVASKVKEADDAAKARAMVAGMAPAPRRSPSVPPATTRESPSAKIGPGPAVPAAAAAKKKGGGGGAFILLFVVVAAAAGAAVMYRDKIFGGETPTTTTTAAQTGQTGTATTATASASPAPSASAAASAAASASGAAASASGAPSASASAPTAAATTTAAATAVATATAVPTATVAPRPTATATQTAAPTATATAQPTAAATAAATVAPKPKPKPKPTDDNPY
jgi:uncharacterized protein (TIGR02266 family)